MLINGCHQYVIQLTSYETFPFAPHLADLIVLAKQLKMRPRIRQWIVSSQCRCRYVTVVSGELVRCTLDVVRVEVLGGAVGNW